MPIEPLFSLLQAFWQKRQRGDALPAQKFYSRRINTGLQPCALRRKYHSAASAFAILHPPSSILFWTLLVTTITAPAAQVTVFAAASLTDSLKQIAADYEKNSGDHVIFNFAASGVLARQIKAGAPADIFFSADETQMDKLAATGLLVPESRRNLLGNSLVIVTPQDSATIHSPTDLTNAAVQRIALGDPRIVPAGTYAQSYLEKIGCWPDIKPKVVPTENVRAVLAAVESGNADAGIIYKSDAAISKKVKVAYEVPAADGPKIVYPIALLKTAPQPAAATKFLSYLSSEAAKKVFRQFGFLVLENSSTGAFLPSPKTDILLSVSRAKLLNQPGVAQSTVRGNLLRRSWTKADLFSLSAFCRDSGAKWGRLPLRPGRREMPPFTIFCWMFPPANV